MSEWKETTLGDLIDIKHGWAFKGEFFNETNQPKNIVVAIGNFDYSGGFRFESTRIKEYLETYPKEYKLFPGDILLAMTCQTAGGEILGIPGRIPDDHNMYLHNQRLGKVEIKNIEATDSSFIYWLCLWRNFNHHLVATATGTKILHTAPERIKSFVFECPPIDEQKQVGKTLDALDRKIENLRKQNETLEQIAQTLFKHWFVDFEFPNADSKPYRSSGGAMQPSALGEIPVGWRVGRLGDIADVKSSKRIFRSEYVEAGIPFYRSKEIIELSSGQETSTKLYISPKRFEEIQKNFEVPRKGEILVTSVGTIGITYLVSEEDSFYFKDGNLTWIRDFKKGFNGVFIFYWLNSDLAKNQIDQNTIGSTQKALTIQALSGLNLVLPDSETLSKYKDLVGVTHARKEINTRQIKKITQIRDTLLPRLMSGKLRINE